MDTVRERKGGAALPLGFIRVWLDLDIRAQWVGIILKVRRVLQHVFFRVFHGFDLNIGVIRDRKRLFDALLLGHVAPGTAWTWLFNRLLSATFRAHSGRFG
jgi:hypothetical protein